MKLTAWIWAVALVPLALAAASAEGIDPLLGTADPATGELWYDGKLLRLEGKGWENTESYYDRLPVTAKDKVRAPVWGLSHDSAGMCLRFTTEAASIRIRWTLRKENLVLTAQSSLRVILLQFFRFYRFSPTLRATQQSEERLSGFLCHQR